jgi:hypothetical protein
MTTELAERPAAMPGINTDQPATPGSMLAIIARAASDPSVDVEKMRALLDLQRELLADQARAEFNAAYTRLASKLPRVQKNGVVNLISKDGKDLGSYKFAKWDDIDRIIRPILAEEGFGLSFNSRPRGADGGGLIVTGTLMHRDGHSISAEMPLPLDTGAGRNNLQATGSTLSYGKRYCAEMLLNIVREGADDDGKAGGEVAESLFITDEQIAEINTLIRETESDSRRVLNYADQAPSVPEMTSHQYRKARDMLLRKKNRMAREAEVQQ